MTTFENIITTTFGFSNSEFKSIQPFFKSQRVKKGDYFIREGRSCQKLGFVDHGILREFLHTNEKEVTKWFSTSGYFAVDLSAFLSGGHSKVSYQAITDVELMVLSKENYDKIGQHVDRWATLEKLFLIKCFKVLEDRVVSHISMNAEERYNQLFAFQPALFNEVPLNNIASMLGMTPETLSRIRKKQTKPIS